MAAPEGNQFWKLRSSHGRKKLFETPELLWEAACEYFQWCDENPWYRSEQMKLQPKAIKDDNGVVLGYTPSVVEIPTARPYTMQGLCLYLDCNTAYFRTFKAQLPEGEQDFNTIITRIEETVFMQKFEGAAVGAFNSNIIARDLGLSDKSDSTLVVKNYDVSLDLT